MTFFSMTNICQDERMVLLLSPSNSMFKELVFASPLNVSMKVLPLHFTRFEILH